MKKYSQLIKESTLPKWSFTSKLSNLMHGRARFIVYKLGLFDVINILLEENTTPINGNPISQYPLSLLFETGLYPEIEKTENGFYSENLSHVTRVLDKNGNWDPVNKLNTNYKDLADLLYDLFTKLGVYQEIPTDTDEKLKSWLLDFKSKNDFYTLIKKYLQFRNYTNNIQYLSKLGAEAEEKVKKLFISKGCEILFQGSDGDPVDMVYGIDLIVKKDKIYTVQVKSKIDSAELAFTKGQEESNSQYSKINWFCAPTDSGIKIYTNHYKTGRDISF